jgi:hypothetical protein
MIIYCCGCGCDVDARLTDGKEAYPHRSDLAKNPFWKCDACGNFVGCHHKTKDRTRPLGVIATQEIRTARSHIHAVLDPMHRSGLISRKKIYKRISDAIGREYHTAELRSVVDARKVYKILIELRNSLAS